MKLKNVSLAIAATVTALSSFSGMTEAASAFTINRTYASWNNAVLGDGTVVGQEATNSAFANYEQAAFNNSNDNYVEFLDNNGTSQVRWGDGAYTQYDAAKAEDGGDNYINDYGWYKNTSDESSWKRGWHKDYTSNKSGLGFAGIEDQTIAAGQILNLGSLKHYNNTIFSGGAASQVDFSLGLDFEELGTQTFNFALNIDETRNDAGYHEDGVCPYQTDDGKGCSDKITWDFDIDEESSFDYNGSRYTLELVGFSDSIDDSDEMITDFISQESGTSSANLWARLVQVATSPEQELDTVKKVPEPGSLLGLAAIAAGVASRRRKSKQA